MLEINVNELNLPTSESLKEVRTNLLYGDEKVIGFTSVSPAEGKTTVTLQLAKEFALLGKNVCVIECDMKRPSMHKALQIKKQEGLSDYLSNRTKKIVNKTSAGFDIVFAGKTRISTTEMLSTEKFKDFLERLRQEYDYVLVDTPPVTGSIDAQVVGNIVDGMVFVVRAGHTKTEQLNKAVQTFRKSNIKIIGAVLNRVNGHEKGYYYYYEDKN